MATGKRWPSLLLFLGLLCGCAKSTETVTCLKEAETATLGAMTGSTGALTAARQFPRAQIKRFDEAPDAVVALKSGQIAAMVIAESTASQVLKVSPELCLLPGKLLDENLAVAIKQGQNELRTEVNRVIAELKADGTLADLKKRWIKTSLDPYETLDIPVPEGGIPLRVGLSATLEPFSFIDENGRVAGHDSELSRLIGLELHRPIRFVKMKFMALIPALQSGKIDLIVSNMTATDERRKTVDFSQPYFVDAQVLLVRKAKQSCLNSLPFVASIINGVENNLIRENRYLLILGGLKVTVLIAILSTIYGTLLGAGVCFMRMSKKKMLCIPAKIYISIVRGTPVLVILMLTFYVVFASVDLSPIAVAVIAFGANFGAYTAEIFRTGIEGIDRGQSEAGIAMGFSRIGTFRHIILPQTVRRILPVYKGEFISLVKMTSIVGYVAVQDLTKASDIIRSRTFDAFFPLVLVALLYFLISWGLIHIVEYFECISDPKYKRAKGARS